MAEYHEMQHVLVVGAGAAGLSTVEALRRRGHRGAVTLLGGESWSPYDRPPLSKQVLAGTWAPDRTRLRSDEDLAGLGATMLLGDPAVGLDATRRRVTTASGSAIDADAVVIATGATARTLPVQPPLAGVHVLRTLDDAMRLRLDLVPGARLVVVGDGVLGTEVAATARTLGLDVTLTGPQPTPMAAQLGPLVSAMLADLHRERGVRLRPGIATTGLVGDGIRVTGVELAGGEILPADVVLVALGARPDVGWLAGSDLTLDDGVVCDSRNQAADGVWAVGDVARFEHRGLGRSMRLENRTNATEQAAAVAAAITGDATDYTPVPYLWTDQFDTKVQVAGLTGVELTATISDGDPADGRFVATYHDGDAAVGVIGWAMPRQTVARRRALTGFVPTAHAADQRRTDPHEHDHAHVPHGTFLGLPLRPA